MTKTEKEQAAIKAGFWFAKDHGRWYVGRDNARLPGEPSTTRAAARDAMITAWEAAGRP
jgi:hypothetical protein